VNYETKIKNQISGCFGPGQAAHTTDWRASDWNLNSFTLRREPSEFGECIAVRERI
jgi:hypothetical protein